MEITRRKLLSTAAVAVHPLIATPRARVELTKTISAQREFYHGWPTLIRRKNGQLMIAYSGGREDHVCPFGRVEIIRSADDGESWSWPEVVMDSPIDDRDAGLCETADGSLLLTTFTSLAFQETLKGAASW